MEMFWEVMPWLIAMAVLIGSSAFFSGSEAALFSLRGPERRLLASGTPGEVASDRLLRNPDRLLSAVLFWNLVVNMIYFAISAMIGARLSHRPTTSLLFGVSSLLTLIFFSEMLPKTLAVVQARQLAGWVGIPLSLAVRLVDPIMPTLRFVNLLSRRLIWPDLKEQPYLEVTDLERAIDLSTADSLTLDQEKTVLRNIVQLSSLPAQEWMRPRKRLRAFHPPVDIEQLRHATLDHGFLLLTDPGGDEIATAVDVNSLSEIHVHHLELQATPVTYVPWCATVADVAQQMQQEETEVASVVNEIGETIGIITMHDVLDAIFMERPNRSERMLNRAAIIELDAGSWHIAGMTNLRRLERFFGVAFPTTRNVTLGGVVQETLERHPKPGDECQWGPLRIKALPTDDETESHFEVTLVIPEGDEP